MPRLLTVIVVLLSGLLLLMPAVIFYWSSYYDVYAGVLFSLFIMMLGVFFYQNYSDSKTRGRLRNLIGGMFRRGKPEEVVFKVRVVPLIHLVILFVVAPFSLFIFYALLTIEFNWVLVAVNLFFWGQFFLVSLLSLFFSWLHVYKWGIRFRLNLLSFDDVSEVRLKWGKRLLVLNRQGTNWLIEQHWYLLTNSADFMNRLSSLRPELKTENAQLSVADYFKKPNTKTANFCQEFLSQEIFTITLLP